jgi:hypothetical protein
MVLGSIAWALHEKESYVPTAQSISPLDSEIHTRVIKQINKIHAQI